MNYLNFAFPMAIKSYFFLKIYITQDQSFKLFLLFFQIKEKRWKAVTSKLNLKRVLQLNILYMHHLGKQNSLSSHLKIHPTLIKWSSSNLPILNWSRSYWLYLIFMIVRIYTYARVRANKCFFFLPFVRLKRLHFIYFFLLWLLELQLWNSLYLLSSLIWLKLLL